MPRARGLCSFLVSAIATAIAACKDVPPPSVLNGVDLAPSEFDTSTFDPNTVIDDGAFTDTTSISVDVTAIQGFLAKTPYGSASFLSTYQSNGVRASDAIIAAARQYRINPIVFLVFTEITQGLVAARTYRFPPERVEYIFGCGCTSPDSCLPQLAGYDRQLACLGQALRTALDEIRLDNHTESGWGPSIESTTLDNVKVTPTNEATAALYDRLPRVNDGKDSGTWAFWKVWQLYANVLNYTGSSGGPSDGAWIGAACSPTRCAARSKTASARAIFPTASAPPNAMAHVPRGTEGQTASVRNFRTAATAWPCAIPRRPRVERATDACAPRVLPANPSSSARNKSLPRYRDPL